MTLPEAPIETDSDVTRFIAREIEALARQEGGTGTGHRRDSLYLACLRAVQWGLSDSQEAPQAPFAIETREGRKALPGPIGPGEASHYLMASYVDSQPSLSYGPWEAIGTAIRQANHRALSWALGQDSDSLPPLLPPLKPEASEAHKAQAPTATREA